VPLPSAISAAGRKVKTYDFRRPDKFSKDQLRTLQAIHENVGRVAAARLSARLRSTLSITLADTAQMVFDEYVTGLALPTQLVVLASDALAGPFLMDFDLALAFAGVDRMLGGSGRIPSSRREPTSIESELIDRLVGDILPAIAEGWAHLASMHVNVTETALGPSLLRVAAPSHVVAVLTYEVRLGGQAAPVTLCYPHASLEPLVPRLSATAWYAQPDRTSTGAAAGRAELAASLRTVDIPVTAVLGAVELSVESLVGLQVGDVIRFEERADSPVLLSVMDQAHAWAIPGRVGDRMALRVVTPLESVEA
jgi:flagellar motor switch protein FliM